MNSKNIVNLQEFTKLKLRVVYVMGRFLPDVIIRTPHKGDVVVKLKEEHYPFVFGSVTQTDKHAKEVISEILKIEEEAKEFLLDSWIKEEDDRKSTE